VRLSDVVPSSTCANIRPTCHIARRYTSPRGDSVSPLALLGADLLGRVLVRGFRCLMEWRLRVPAILCF
jgi:hypothetical protein